MNLLRLVGALGFVVCGGCAGNAVNLKIQAHLDALEQVIVLLQELEQEVSFRHADLNLLCEKLAREGRIQTGQGSLQSAFPPQALSKEEAALFRECFAGLGRRETEEECSRLVFYRERFETFFQKRAGTAQQQQVLTQKLGLAIGLAVGILFL